MSPHLAVERRAHLRVTKIEFGDIELSPGRSKFSGRLFCLEVPVVDHDLRRGALLFKGGVAFHFNICVKKRSFLRLDLRFSLNELLLILLLLYCKKKVAFLDDLSVLEVNLVQIAFHPGDQLHRVHGGGVARELDIFADVLDLGQHHRHHRAGRRRGRILRRGFWSAGSLVLRGNGGRWGGRLSSGGTLARHFFPPRFGKAGSGRSREDGEGDRQGGGAMPSACLAPSPQPAPAHRCAKPRSHSRPPFFFLLSLTIPALELLGRDPRVQANPEPESAARQQAAAVDPNWCAGAFPRWSRR